MATGSPSNLWWALTLAIGAFGASCGQADAPRRVVPSYDTFDGRLIRLAADLNGDGRLDQWTDMDGNRPVRSESDLNGDGRIDRWEYFDDQANLVRVGTSSEGDGVEDTWTSAASADGESRVARSRRRDRSIDRMEFFRDGALVRVEEDSNADGLTDKWEAYENGALREVRLDTSLARGRPDRRLTYDGQGQMTGIEMDEKGDGQFVPLAVPEVRR